MSHHGHYERKSRFETGLTALRWGIALLIVAGAHAGAVWAALNWHESDAMPSEPPPAIMIELAPLAVAPPTPQPDVAPGPQQTESEPEPTPDTPTPVEDAKPDPTPPTPVQTVQEAPPAPTPPDPPVQEVKPDPAPVPPPEMKIPELPKQDQADAVLAPPPPPPPPKPKPQKKPPHKTHEAARKKPIRRDKKRVRRTMAPPTSEARRSQEAAAPSAGASFRASVSPASWKGDLMAHLNRYKRYPSDASGFGTASIAFTINRSGQVLSSRLIGSSGDRALDAEAVALPRHASPVPAPPPNIGGRTITLTVPIRFNR